MARITCANSGVEFSCEHLPLSLSSREVLHPFFYIPRRRLISLTPQWIQQKLSPTESYLLYLSLLHSTDLIEWRVPAVYHAKTAQIIANNMEQLIHIIGRIDVIKHPSFVLPHFVISHDTCSLENSYHWIQVWLQNYNDWSQHIKDHSNDQEITRREHALQKLIKTSHKRIEDYPTLLAGWARKAGDFPTFSVTIRGIKQELADYWEDIIIKCAKAETAFQVNSADLDELIGHCEDNIAEEGSIYSNALMKYLRRGKHMQESYLGFGDIDLASSTTSRSLTAYTILDTGTTAEKANIQNMIDSAPAGKPDKKNYPDTISYLKAQARWLMKEAYQAGSQASSPTPPTSSPQPE